MKSAPSIRLALIRHAPTPWSAIGRLQGRTDTPLSAQGVRRAESWAVPETLEGLHWLCSPLRRAVETAGLLGLSPQPEPALIEMSWGVWEGHRLAVLRADPASGMVEQEARGLDLQPPGGESPRAVQARLHQLFARLAAEGVDIGAVTHKGVIRAVLALATGWDMRSKPPHRLSWSAAHLFRLAPDGTPSVERLNLPLERDAAATLAG